MQQQNGRRVTTAITRGWRIDHTLVLFQSTLHALRSVFSNASGLGTHLNNLDLRLYAWALLAGHVTVWAFLNYTKALRAVTQDLEPLCWPYFQSCWKFRFADYNDAIILLQIYTALIVATAIFLMRRRSTLFWIGLILTNLLLFAITSLDYRLKTNELYMLFWINGVFLASPAKRWSIPTIIVGFYFWAGRLKLNYEWLSGSVLYHELFVIPARYAWVACTYVVLLEMVLIWGLLARTNWIVWLTLSQLAIFHIESLSQIHWFYPVLMATILSWFVIEQATISVDQRAYLTGLMQRRAPVSVYALILLFAACQLVPLAYKGDPALTGQGRIFALNMFEARQECVVYAVLRYNNGTTSIRDLQLHQLPPRTICDPVVYFDRVQNICRSRALNLRDVDFVMSAKRSTDSEFTPIVNEKHFCQAKFSYSILRNNNWMLSGKDDSRYPQP